ncbi:hypothetical protein [Asticcacaulis excentricus]|uniref:Uncharacterized protein n=1 Tax=Asticcacaulis excentricus (strain ATCC 15261 / DSM 4724 / KCTC 12464 / NCIMB 9791 / VKM B-1370 / CB 48) TaxID=573065 RepID=E8RT63_ASTEC|nr:hypothetical protein [Asticcacaulis excentricus]ADU14684.1 hypothetical protein Astex_3048 [Asticcacaulis excentricus CB 48]
MSGEIPSFHDAKFVGIQLLGEKARLTLVRYNGEPWEIVLTGLEALQMDNFRQGNIVTHFELIQKVRPDKELLERLFPSPHPAAAQVYQDAYAEFLDKKVALVEAGQAVLLSIEPAYGADLIAFTGQLSAKKLTSTPV